MASNPPGKCCFQGVKHEGVATGEFTTFSDFEVYFKYPENKATDNGILLLTDIFGHRFINNQLIADQLAANGYFVVMPDLFYGDAIELDKAGSIDLMTWLSGGYHEKKIAHTPDVIDKVVEKSIAEMRSKYNVKRIGVIGYCFGAKYAVRFLKDGVNKADVGFIAHPSFVEKDELGAITAPLAIAAAEKDSIFPSEKRHESEQILVSLGVPYEITLYGGVEHGFAVRGDMSNQSVRYAKESAFLQVVRWFGEFLRVD